jgi:D-alanyl-D-alanine carboxypeptidase
MPETQSQTPDRKFIAASSAVSFALLVGFIFVVQAVLERTPDPSKQQGNATGALQIPDHFQDISIRGKAGYVFDMQTGETLFSKNATAQLPLASLTKIMIALLAHEYVDPDNGVLISAAALAEEGSSGFTEGEIWRAGDLLDFTLMTSSNDGAAAIAEAVEAVTGKPIFVTMNTKAASIGLHQTYFLNETGLDENELLFSGAYGSARDVAELVAYALINANGVFEATARVEGKFYNRDGTLYTAKNTNDVIGKIPGLVMGKTGYTDLAGGNLAVAFEKGPGHVIIAVVLGSTAEGRFLDMEKLVDASLATF